MYKYDEKLFRDRWLGAPGVPWLKDLIMHMFWLIMRLA